MDYYSTDWFSHNIPALKRLFGALGWLDGGGGQDGAEDSTARRVVEVGRYKLTLA